MTQMNGIVGGLSVKGGGGFFLKETGDTYYSCKEASQRNGVERGSEVSFSYESRESGGRTYNNIQGNVVTAEGGGQAAAPAVGGSPQAAPVARTSNQIQIVRQNCNTQANAYIASQGLQCSVADAIEISKQFEAFVIGD